jgi:hypothetical protein
LYATLCTKNAHNANIIELEAKFGTTATHPPLTKVDFNHAAEKLLSMGFRASPPIPVQLVKLTRVSDGARIVMTGATAAEHFCQTGTLPPNGTTFLTKTAFATEDGKPVAPADFSEDFNFRVSLAKEKPLTIEMADTDLYRCRYLHRQAFEHADYPNLRVDMSVVKTSAAPSTLSKVPLSAVFGPDVQPSYEIEVEATWPQPIAAAALSAQLLKVCSLILSGIQGSNAPAPYPKLANAVKSYTALTKSQQFIGPSPVALQQTAITQKLTGAYTVTDKADGERFLLLVDEAGDIFLLSSNMHPISTGTTTTDSALFNTVLDGERILRDKKGKFIGLYAAFDVYFVGGRDVRALPLAGDRAAKEETRLDILQQVCAQLAATSKLRVRAKQFRGHQDGKGVFEGTKDLLNHVEELEYETDGLIYTPTRLGVGLSYEGQPFGRGKNTWPEALKWKPAEQLSIDFHVEPVAADEKDVTVVNLLVGQTSDPALPACKRMRLATAPQSRGESSKYQSAPFHVDPTIGQARIPTVGGRMVAENGDSIGAGDVVEFRYDETGKWQPMRVRHDKSKPNHRSTAEDNWRSIAHPVTLGMLVGDEVPDVDVDVYYNHEGRRRGTKSETDELRRFHNAHVKQVLLTRAAAMSPGNKTLMDLACGKGGDFMKWDAAGITFALGVDVSEDNIHNVANGACARYVDWRQPHAMEVLYVVGNSSKDLRQPSSGAIPDAADAKVVQNLFRQFLHPVTDQARLSFPFDGVVGGHQGFGVTSCQFALHYMFADKATLYGFVANVARCTALSGVFVATCYDGQIVYDKLQGRKKLFANGPSGRRIWSVARGYASAKPFEANAESLGMKVTVFQESINQEIVEYLVHPEYFANVMAEFGFEEVVEPTTNPNFRAMYAAIPDASNRRMTLAEQEISFLNRWFMFKKVR